MARVKEIYAKLKEFAPIGLKMDFDNVGFLVGFSDREVNKILVSLDITDEVIVEAMEEKAQLIVSHHPLFFSLKSVTDDDRTGRKIATMLANQISAICMHTNLDAAEGGVNDMLAEKAGLTKTDLFSTEGTDENGQPFSYGRIGFLPDSMKLGEYLSFIKNSLGTNGLRYHDAGLPVHKVGVVGGSGGGYLNQAVVKGCDTLVTADIKYDVFLEAKELGINLIDGDHFCTENVVTPALEEKLRRTFPGLDIMVSKRHRQTAQFY